MKKLAKIILLVSALVLLAAACNRQTPPAMEKPAEVQRQQIQVTHKVEIDMGDQLFNFYVDEHKTALDLFPPSERLANTLIIPLNEKSYGELLEIIQEFSERLQNFAAHNQEAGERLYQLILNLSPTGGKVE
jgi:hypothetical protein